MFSLSKETVDMHQNLNKLAKVQQFLSSKSRGTVSNNHPYRTSLAYLYQFLAAKYSGLTLESIIDSINNKKIDVYKFLDEFVAFLHSRKISQASRNQYLTGVKSYLQYHDVDIIPYKFRMRVTLPKIPREDEKPIDGDDIRTILVKCHNRRLKTYLLVLASSGVRAIEACALRVLDIYFDESPVRIHVRPEYSKTKRPRDVYISDEAARFLKEWVEHRFGVIFDNNTKIDKQTSESLVFQVFNIHNLKVEPQTIYNKLVQQFHELLDEVGFGQRKDGMQRRQITFHSFRRFVKTTISNSPAGSDYSRWFLGHTKSSYYVPKLAVRAEIYSTKLMKYFTFLEYPTIAATGRNFDARINELEKEKQIMSQKHEEEMKSLHERMDRMDRIMKLMEHNPILTRAKKSALERLANTK